MRHITRLKITKKTSVFKDGFTWNEIPSFAVIAGINGSGKTKLLEAIVEASTNKDNRFAEVSPIIFLPQIKYLDIKHDFEDLSQWSFGSTTLEQNNTDFLKYVNNGRKPHKPDLESAICYLETLHQRKIEDLIVKNPETVFTPFLAQLTKDGFNNSVIVEIFKAYEQKFNQIKAECFDNADLRQKVNYDKEKIYEAIGHRPPWEVINNIFEKYNFTYRIKEPLSGFQYRAEFIDPLSPSEIIAFKNLSSGEKLIVTLILWSYNQFLGNKIKVLLMDEFDAHLNPSLSKMFVDLIKEKLVKEFGIQVIMTTHSPSTLAHVDDDDIFWISRGQNIVRSDKKKIVPILSDGVMTFEEGKLLLESISKESEVTLFTEGLTDCRHLRAAISKLNIKLSIGIHSCDGSNKLHQFLIGFPNNLLTTNIIVGLFDYDKAGLKEVSKSFDKLSEANDYLYIRKGSNNIFALLIPPPNDHFKHYKNCPIEFLYSREVLVSHGMIGEKMSAKEINNIRTEQDQLNHPEYTNLIETYYFKVNEKNKTDFSEKVFSLDHHEFKNFQQIFDMLNLLLYPRREKYPQSLEPVSNEDSQL